jgi:hypothetical protein
VVNHVCVLIAILLAVEIMERYKITQTEIEILNIIFDRLITHSIDDKSNIETILLLLRESIEDECKENSLEENDNFMLSCLIYALKHDFYKNIVTRFISGCIKSGDITPSPSQSVVRSDQEILISIESELKKFNQWNIK